MPPFSTVRVRELVDQSASGQLDVPEFQREFVWRPDQVTALVDSLYRDFPIGQILTWAHPGYEEARAAPDVAPGKRWLVDGQQRATALCLVFGRKPHWWTDAAGWDRRLAATRVVVNLCTDAAGLQFGLTNPIRSADPKWVAVRELLGPDGADPPAGTGRLDELAGSIFRKLPGRLATRFPKEALRARLASLGTLGDRVVAVAEVHHDSEDVAEIFTRLNQQGTAVTDADVSLAVAATRQAGWVRDEFLPFLRNLAESGFQLDPGVVLRVLSAIGDGHVRLGDLPPGFWTSTAFEDSWRRTKESLSAVVSGFAGSGILSSSILPSQAALVPLATLHATQGTRGFLLPRAMHWFLMAARDGRYSAAGASTLGEDVRHVRDASDFAEALQALRGELEVEMRIDAAEFLERGAWQRPLRLILYLTLYHRRATDWLSRRSLGHGRTDGALDYGFAPYWHPFFPRSRTVLRSPRFDYSEDEVGALANLVVLNERPRDRRWTASAPLQYLAASRVTDEQLAQQLIPPDRVLWDPGRYRDFLAARAPMLAAACNDHLAALVGSAR
jgi:Protein of unknown function DUF262